jgi:hypothetical protein
MRVFFLHGCHADDCFLGYLTIQRMPTLRETVRAGSAKVTDLTL